MQLPSPPLLWLLSLLLSSKRNFFLREFLSFIQTMLNVYANVIPTKKLSFGQLALPFYIWFPFLNTFFCARFDVRDRVGCRFCVTGDQIKTVAQQTWKLWYHMIHKHHNHISLLFASRVSPFIMLARNDYIMLSALAYKNLDRRGWQKEIFRGDRAIV